MIAFSQSKYRSPFFQPSKPWVLPTSRKLFDERAAVSSFARWLATCHVSTAFRFEALEYAGLLKEARSEKNRQLLEQSRDYVLRTVDGMRHDIRAQLNPKRMSSRIQSSMEKDKAGTSGFVAGAFLGFL